MFRYLQQMPVEQQLLLGAFVAVLPFLTWAALLQRKYSIPFPLPQPLPRPLPLGWSTFILTFGLQLLVVSVFAAVAACLYYSYIGEMEKTGGRVIMLAVLSFAYDVGGRIGNRRLPFLGGHSDYWSVTDEVVALVASTAGWCPRLLSVEGGS